MSVLVSFQLYSSWVSVTVTVTVTNFHVLKGTAEQDYIRQTLIIVWMRWLSEKSPCDIVATCMHHGDNLIESTGRYVSVGGQQVTTVVPVVLRRSWQRENTCRRHLIGGRVPTVSSLTTGDWSSSKRRDSSFRYLSPEMEPGHGSPGHRVTGSAILTGSGRVPGQCFLCADPVLWPGSMDI